MPARLRHFFILLVAISAIYAFMFSGNIKKKYFGKKYDTYQGIIQLTKNGGHILNTPGCMIPWLDPFDKSVKNLIVEREPYVCPGKPSPIVVQPNGILILNESILETHYNVSKEMVDCTYQPILRLPEPKGKVREEYFSIEEGTKLQFGTPLPHDLLMVNCSLGNETSTQYVAIAPIKPRLEKTKSSIIWKPAELSVVMIGVDSVSKLNFMRHFKRTYKFLRENLSPFEFRGHTKVGDNTFPNLIPMLTGHFVEYYWNESLMNTMFFDDVDIIWKRYSEVGHRTFYAEDMPFFGTFYYGKRGFRNQPVDYYYRPMALAIDKSAMKEKSATYCMGSQLETDIIYKYLENFIATMGQRPFFAFAMVSILTHGYLNDAGYADEPTYRVLKYIWETGTLNNSLLVFFSDHGIRFGDIRQTYLGKFEERMPFMFLNFPRWYLEKHPEYAENLRINQQRLTTHFDIHATLVHLLNSTGRMASNPELTPHGLSLMEQISDNRTCDEASILPHWCPCQVYESVPLNESAVINSAIAIIDSINAHLTPFKKKCAVLEVDKVTDARSGQPNEKVLRFLRRESEAVDSAIVYGEKVEGEIDYLITLSAHPSGGVFEGTVRHNIKSNTFVVQDVSRLNEYGKQSSCIESQLVRKFCYCVS